MARKADHVAAVLGCMASRHRLLLLCQLHDGEHPVGELAQALGISVPNASQHLAVLRRKGLVTARRRGREIRYQLADASVRRLIGVLHELYCGPEEN